MGRHHGSRGNRSPPGNMPAMGHESPGFLPSMPGSMPGSPPGSMPGTMPGSPPGSIPGSLPGSVPGFPPGSLPGSPLGLSGYNRRARSIPPRRAEPCNDEDDRLIALIRAELGRARQGVMQLQKMQRNWIVSEAFGLPEALDMPEHGMLPPAPMQGRRTATMRCHRPGRPAATVGR